jgi:hypothetical protein
MNEITRRAALKAGVRRNFRRGCWGGANCDLAGEMGSSAIYCFDCFGGESATLCIKSFSKSPGNEERGGAWNQKSASTESRA